MESRSITKIQNSKVDKQNNLVLEVTDQTGIIQITLNADLWEGFENAVRKWKVVREKREEIERLQAVIKAENK